MSVFCEPRLPKGKAVGLDWLVATGLLLLCIPTFNDPATTLLIRITDHYCDAAVQGYLLGYSGMLLLAATLIPRLVLDGILVRVIKRRSSA